MKKYIILIGIITAGVLSAALPSLPARPAGFVTDAAGVLSAPVRERIERLLAETERVAGIEIALVTLPSLDGDTIDRFGQDLFDKWRIGKKGKDNGLLFLLARDERKVHLFTGYGLEEYLPDGLCGELLDRYFIPSARTGNFDDAFVLTVEGIIRVLQKKIGFTIEGVPPRAASSPFGLVKLILAVIFLIILFSRPGRNWILPFLIGQMLGGGGFSSGRGGFGGSSGGGFGGFGGGFSGGGGAGRSF